MFSTLQSHYNTLVEAIIRPPRDLYVLEDLGPRRFKAGSRVWVRQDLDLVNKRGLRLSCSHFVPEKLNLNMSQNNSASAKWPCVIYLHGNSSSRVEAMTALEVVLPLPSTLFCFDFSGSGLSEGDYVSLGYYEKDDLQCVIEHLRSCGYIGSIGLWGRSMGAVTSLLHADRDPSLACLVLDSPFCNLRKLAMELVESGQYLRFSGGSMTMLTTWVVDACMHFIKGSVEERANFDIDNLVPLNHVSSTYVPAYFIAGSEDTFILPHHAEELWRAYAGVDKIYEVIADADHNSQRPRTFLKKIADFLRAALRCEESANSRSSYNNNTNTTASNTNNMSMQQNGPGGAGVTGTSTTNSSSIDKLDPEAKSAVAAQIMPPAFTMVQSRSRPGTIVYEDTTTRRRYGSLAQAWRAYRQRTTEGNPGNNNNNINSVTQVLGNNDNNGGNLNTSLGPGSTGVSGTHGTAGTSLNNNTIMSNQLVTGGATTASNTVEGLVPPQPSRGSEPPIGPSTTPVPVEFPFMEANRVSTGSTNLNNSTDMMATDPMANVNSPTRKSYYSTNSTAAAAKRVSPGQGEYQMRPTDFGTTTNNTNTIDSASQISRSGILSGTTSSDSNNLLHIENFASGSGGMPSFSVGELIELGFTKHESEDAYNNCMTIETAVEYIIRMQELRGVGGLPESENVTVHQSESNPVRKSGSSSSTGTAVQNTTTGTAV